MMSASPAPLPRSVPGHGCVGGGDQGVRRTHEAPRAHAASISGVTESASDAATLGVGAPARAGQIPTRMTTA
jgi:hypothetical protein